MARAGTASAASSAAGPAGGTSLAAAASAGVPIGPAPGRPASAAPAPRGRPARRRCAPNRRRRPAARAACACGDAWRPGRARARRLRLGGAIAEPRAQHRAMRRKAWPGGRAAGCVPDRARARGGARPSASAGRHGGPLHGVVLVAGRRVGGTSATAAPAPSTATRGWVSATSANSRSILALAPVIGRQLGGGVTSADASRPSANRQSTRRRARAPNLPARTSSSVERLLRISIQG